MIEAVEALLECFPADAAVAHAARAAARVMPGNGAEGARVAAKVLRAFADARLAESDLHGTFGYGYDDAARDAYETLLARVFDAELVLARFSFVSGTHAIVTALSALCEPGSTLICAAGRPYDTLRNALADAPQALARRGVGYVEVALREDGSVDDEALAEGCARAQRAVVFVQRSRGYAARPSLSAARCGEIALAAKRAATTCAVLIDNCYGELVEATEPTAHGADLIAGSLIKNLGGGLAPGGGYIAGRADLVERIAEFHYAPGLGRSVGSSLGFGRALIQGLFLAPQVVAEALAGLAFTAAMFEQFGYCVDPAPCGGRCDIVQSVQLGDRERLLSFVRGLQGAMPLNAAFAPEPGAVPGYAEPIVMSGGAFVPGATIELSCDAPLRPPYAAYVQGGTSRSHAVLGALHAAGQLAQEKLLYAANRTV